MQGLQYQFSYQSGFGNPIESEKKQRHCRLRIQTWVYIHCGISAVTSLIGIVIGILLLVRTEWHEKLFIYRLKLAYIRRADPTLYWIAYRIFFGVWISIHVLHVMTIMSTLVAVQKTNIKLLRPQILLLILQIGLFIVGISSLIVFSTTASKVTWLALIVFLFHTFFASTNLHILAVFHRFLDEKLEILNDLLMAQAKTVHFKDDSSMT